MEISFNMPYVFGDRSTPTVADEYVLAALQAPIAKVGKLYLRSGPKIVPYNLGPIAGRIVTYAFCNAFDAKSSSLSNAIVLKSLLEGLVRANLVYLRYDAYAPLYESGVYYKRTRVWDSIPALYQRGYGDCKSLTSAYVAEHLLDREQARPVFRWMPRAGESGIKDFHILVETDYGYEDPSRKLGMGKDENAYFNKR